MKKIRKKEGNGKQINKTNQNEVKRRTERDS